MKQLAESFTFELAKPKKLVTTGVYRYMQHPSYLPDGLITIANFALFANLDGWAGCFLPEWVVRLWVPMKGYELVPLAGIWFVVIRIRILQEEAMLREAFGAEWELWHRKTARCIPYVF